MAPDREWEPGKSSKLVQPCCAVQPLPHGCWCVLRGTFIRDVLYFWEAYSQRHPILRVLLGRREPARVRGASQTRSSGVTLWEGTIHLQHHLHPWAALKEFRATAYCHALPAATKQLAVCHEVLPRDNHFFL